jgi:hypothetical protein
MKRKLRRKKNRSLMAKHWKRERRQIEGIKRSSLGRQTDKTRGRRH